MKTFNFYTKRIFGMSLITSIVFLILGLFLLIKPETTITVISNIIGIFMMIAGANSFVKYVKNKELNSGMFKFELVYGIISVAAGLILILNPQAVASILPFILGIFFVISGATKFQYAIDIKINHGDRWLWLLIIAIMTLGCGILFIFNPFKGAIAITKLIGIFIVIYAVLDIVNYCILRKDMKSIIRVVE